MSHLSPPLILIAEPSPMEREMYGEYLRWRGFQVEESEDGREAFERALVVQPDVVCASFVMRRGTGAELCAALHADERTSHIPVIILTTLTTAIEMQTARASGCDALLVKPCLPEQLREEASRLIGESRRARPGAPPGRPLRPPDSSPR